MEQAYGEKLQKIVFVRDTDELGHVQNSYSPSDHFLTSDIAAYSQLLSLGREVSGTWDYLNGEARRQILVEATRLKDEWYDDLRDCLIYRGINMGDAVKFPVYHFLLEALTAVKMARLFFDHKAPSVVNLAPISGIPARYGLAQRSDVAVAVFAHSAQLLGASIESNSRDVDQFKSVLLSSLRRSVPTPVRRIRRNLLSWWSDRGKRSEALQFASVREAATWLSQKPAKYTVVGASAYQSLLMLIPLTSYLEQQADFAALLVHTGDKLDYGAILSDPRTSDFAAGHRSNSFKYLEVFKATALNSKEHEKFIKRMWDCFATWQKDYRGPYPELFSNPDLEFQYKYLLGSLMSELCRVVDAAYDIFQQIRPDMLLVGNVSEKDLTMASVARAMNVPSVLVPHNLGWASPEDYEYPVDYIVVQNEGTARFLEEIVAPRKLLVAGDLKRKKSDLRRSPKPAPTTDQQQPGRSTQTTILVLTGGFTPGMFQACNPGSFYSALSDFVAHLNERTDWKIIFRAHPRLESFKWIKELVQHTQAFISGQLTLETNAVAEEIIPEVDLVLMLDYRSSPAIAAWKNGVPIIRWKSSTLLYSLNDIFREDWFPQVTSSLELERMIDRFNSDEEWRSQWISKGQQLTNEYFSTPELPESIFADMLTKICQKSADEPKAHSGKLEER